MTVDDRDLLVLARAISGPSGSTNLYWLVQLAILALLVIASALEPLVWIATGAHLILVVVQWRTASRSPSAAAAAVSLNGRYAIEPTGIRRVGAHSETFVAWSGLDRITQTGTHLILRLGGGGWVIPFRCFASDSERARFVNAINDGRALHVG